MSSRSFYPFHVLAPWGVVIFFVLKASISGIWVVRPWDVPDEVGHFSYIKDLATGKGLPVLHETMLDETVWRTFAPETHPSTGSNWIAQHPPLYHVLMVPVYWMGALFGPSFWGSFYLIRIVTSILFGLGLWALMTALREVGLNWRVALGFGIMLGSIPNHTYLAAAVSHDALVFLFGTLVLLFWVRFNKSRSILDLILLGISLGLGGVVKYTFLVLVPPILLLTFIPFLRNSDIGWKHWIWFSLLALGPITLWAIRNLIVYGEPLPVDTTGFQSENPLNLSFLEFGRSYPEFSILLQSFWGLLGWMGDGVLRVRWLQIYSIYQQAFAIPLILLFCLTLFYFLKEGLDNWKRIIFGLEHVFILLILVRHSQWIEGEYSFYKPLFFLGIAVIAWSFAEYAFLLGSKNMDKLREIEVGALVVFLFFASVHLYKIYTFTVSSGALQGTFGRYYLPVVGFALVGFFARGLRPFPFAGQLVLGIGMLYGCVELYIWLHEAIPFFHING